MIASQAHLDPRFKNFPNLPEDEYESILAVPILARGERLEGALNVRTREPREFTEDEIDLLLAIAAQVAQSIEHAKLYEEAQRRVHELEALARISEAVSESLYLEESLEAIVKTTMDALSATGAALVLEDGAIAWPEGAPTRTRSASRCAGAAGRSASSSPTARRRSPSTTASCSPRSPSRRRSRSSTGARCMRGVLAQEIHHRVKNNLQTVASLLRLQARTPTDVDPRKALEDSVNRILAIAAVHEVLTEQRDEDVDLAELLDRLRAMLVQGVGGGTRGDGRARAGARSPATARPRSRSSSRSCCRTRSSTAASTSASSSRGGTARSCSRSPTTAPGSPTSRRRAPASRSCARSFATSCAGARARTAEPGEVVP